MGEREADTELMRAAYARWKDMPPVTLDMHRQDAWIVMMGLQTAANDPGCAPQLARRMESVGRRIQEVVCHSLELYTMAEEGWTRDYAADGDDSGDGA